MKLRNLIPLAMLALASQESHANAHGAGAITKIGGLFASPSSSVYFGVSPVPVNRAACNNHSDYQFVFDPNTPEGKALYAALLTAKTTGASILVYGSGNCILGQPMESVSYWILDP